MGVEPRLTENRFSRTSEGRPLSRPFPCHGRPYWKKALKRCLSEKIAEALRQELRFGCHRAGAPLPSVDALRQRFGAGEYAVRHALHRLRDEGLISLKQRMGAVVTEKNVCAWKGRVALVTVDASASYFRQKLAIQLAWRFCEAGWSFEPIFIACGQDGSLDLAPLRRYAANGLDFAILITDQAQVAEECDSLSVPYIALNGYTRNYPNACAVVRESFRQCFSDLIRALRERKVKTLLEFDIERLMDRSFKNQLFEAGIDVRRVLCKWDNRSCWTLSDVKRCGYRAVADFFAEERHRAHPPDVILFDDDYMASGGIVALLECGLRMPKDVKVVTYANRGNEPVAGVTLARVEADPVSYGDSVAAYVLNLLAGRRASPPRILWRFIPGDSL